MALPAPIYYLPEEYLALDRGAGFKSEYIDGRIVAMAGASREHSLIGVNISTALNLQLRHRPCEVHGSDLRVKVADSGLFTYPDVTIVCEEPIFVDTELDTLVNPTVIVEVLSPTTEAYDRGEKFARYQEIDALREYVLVAQDRPRVERFRRQGDDWLLTTWTEPGTAVDLPSIGCTLALDAIYAKVVFPPPKVGRP